MPTPIDELNTLPGRTELVAVFADKYGAAENRGWMQRLWTRLDYFSPDDYYETTVSKLVFPQCDWLDVGCGRNIFPGNLRLAQKLALRCGYLLGADPDGTIAENTLVHEKVQAPVESLRLDRQFDLITLRMVAEHVERPDLAVASLARLAKPGGLVVVLTVNRWSPAAVAASIVPHALHHPIKRMLWNCEEKDTFRVSYRMNTRKQLARCFEAAGFRERAFAYLDDCRTFYRYRWIHRAELGLRRLFKVAGLPHPENCLLGIYQRLGAQRHDEPRGAESGESPSSALVQAAARSRDGGEA